MNFPVYPILLLARETAGTYVTYAKSLSIHGERDPESQGHTEKRAGTTCKQEATGIQDGNICLNILRKGF